MTARTPRPKERGRETVSVLVNDSDPDGDALTIISVSPTNAWPPSAATNVIFTPTNNFLGTTFVGYPSVTTSAEPIRAHHGSGDEPSPVAQDDIASTPKNVAVTIPVLMNDSDPDGDA